MRTTIYFVGGVSAAAVLIALSEVFTSRWPVVVGAASVATVWGSILDEPTGRTAAGRAVTDPTFDPVVDEPTRLQICGILAAATGASFGTIRTTLELAAAR